MYAVTGASGQLGRLVVEALLGSVDASSIVALVRHPSRLGDLAGRGVVVRPFDYDEPETLASGLDGVDRLLLISSSQIGDREPQHRAVIDAARTAGVGFIAYTSILHAGTSPLSLAIGHRATEAAIEASGLAYAFLRNGWYTENYTQAALPALAGGVLLGSAGKGEISAASREDYAAAAAKVLTGDTADAQIHELAGDDAFTLAEFAATLAEVSGKPVVYRNLSEAAYRQALEAAGLPKPVANMLAESDAKAADDALFDDGRALSRLIDRPSTPMRKTVETELRARPGLSQAPSRPAAAPSPRA